MRFSPWGIYMAFQEAHKISFKEHVICYMKRKSIRFLFGFKLFEFNHYSW